jgi:hypothetical protein
MCVCVCASARVHTGTCASMRVTCFILEVSEEILKTFTICIYAEGYQMIIILVSMGYFTPTLHKALIDIC